MLLIEFYFHQIQSPTRKKLPPHSLGNIQSHVYSFPVNLHREIGITFFETLSDVGVNHFRSDYNLAVVFSVTEQQGQYPVITEIGKVDSGKTFRNNRSNPQIARRKRSVFTTRSLAVVFAANDRNRAFLTAFTMELRIQYGKNKLAEQWYI